jgi:hypothetical protein
MKHQVITFARISLWMLPVWAVLLFGSTLTEQPDPQTAFADFAVYVASSQFLWSHLIGSIAGAAIGSIGVIGLMLYLKDTRAAGRAISGMVATVAANVLTASVFGVAAFAEPAMGRLFQAGQQNALDFYNQSYTAPLFGTALLGMLLFMAGGVFLGSAIAASGRFPGWAGRVYAIATTGFALGLFFAPIVQTISSALLLISTLIIAGSARRADAQQAFPVGISQDA